MTDTDALLQLAQHDRTSSALTSRRESLPERDELAGARQRLAELERTLAERQAALEALIAEEQRLDAELTAVEDRARTGETRLYSGEITSPRDLQALQAEIDQLHDRKVVLEDEQLTVMEHREVADSEVRTLGSERGDLMEMARDVAQRLAAAESQIDAALRSEAAARDAVVAKLEPDVLARYERIRARTGTDGAARLVGVTCDGCHLSIPTTEAETIRREPERLATCDNCGRILVPA